MLVVLDTNIIVSALLSPHGKPAYVFNRFINGDFTLCADERIIAEYYAVLSRPKFKFNPQLIDRIISFIRTHALIVTPMTLSAHFDDESDKKLYEEATTCNATLITGNLKHFPVDPCVKSVNEIF